MLTERQHRLLCFLHGRLQEAGVPPSFDEMRVAAGLKSKSGVHQIIPALEERGYISRPRNRARAIKVLKLPDNMVQAHPTPNDRDDSDSTALPFLGRIAAGLPIEAIENPEETLAVPNLLIGQGSHFVLEVCGDSMCEVGILDGDYVLIKQQNTAPDGTIVAACIDRDEVTLKRLQTKGNSVALKPENPAFQTRILGADRIEIKGVLVGLIRRY